MHSRVERLIGHIGTETRPKLLREAAVVDQQYPVSFTVLNLSPVDVLLFQADTEPILAFLQRLLQADAISER